MKILILSLLRIGDVAMSAPVLRGLRETHPKAEIHLLLNGQCRALAPLMPYLDRVIEFDRAGLQAGLGEVERPVFESYDRLGELVDELNGIGYEWVINFTHNKLSGWLAGLIQAPKKTGLSLDGAGAPTFGSPWFRQLNHQINAESSEVFHFNDVFRYAVGVSGEGAAFRRRSRQALVETEKGRLEAEALLEGVTGELVTVQALTSDVKKDWGLASFAAALTQIQHVVPEAAFLILGAPFEKTGLEDFVARLKATGLRAHLAILSLEGAFSLLKRSRLLLTGDTSIKHLGAVAHVPIVEISVGSSDAQRTGPYAENAVIVKTREACAPCPHAKACHRDTHACAEGLPPEVVAMVAVETMAGRSFQLREIAENFKNEVSIARVDLFGAGFWTAADVNEAFTERAVGRWLDLVVKRAWLDRGAQAEMGTLALETKRFLTRLHPMISEFQWQDVYDTLEHQAGVIDGRLNGVRVGGQYLRGYYEDPRKMREFALLLVALREKIRHWPLFASFKTGLDLVLENERAAPFVRFRQFVDLIVEMDARLAIVTRLVRALAHQTEKTAPADRL